MLYSLNHHSTCRFEVRQALLYQLVSGLTDENGKYNYAKAVHHYPPFFDISCSAKNYKIASALTARSAVDTVFNGRMLGADSDLVPFLYPEAGAIPIDHLVVFPQESCRHSDIMDIGGGGLYRVNKAGC